jgi:hypothetical protein
MASWLKFLSGSAPRNDDPILSASAEENEEWLRHLATRNPTQRKAGSSIDEEYKAWLIQRAKSSTAKQRALERAIR